MPIRTGGALMSSDVLIIFAATGGCAAVAGAATYALARRDLRRRGAVLAAVGCALLVGATSLFIPYLPMFAFLVAAATYLVVRRRFRVGHALAGAAVILIGGLAFSVLTMIAALNSM
jgi:ABC-type glycerol-3-phosphate transport system permease component